MSKINGEKARAAIARKRGMIRRVKERERREAWRAASGAAPGEAVPAEPARPAEKPKKAAASKTPEQLVEDLRPRRKSGSAPKTE